MKKIERMIKILDNNGVPHREINDRLEVHSMIIGDQLFEHPVDVTDWTILQLYDWLGYDIPETEV